MDKKNHRLDEFFERYRMMVIRNAYLTVKDYYAAEDICQETFLRLSRDLHKVPPENVKAWLLQVSGNLAIDYIRKGGKYQVDVGLEEADLEIASEFYIDPERMMEKKEACEKTNRVLEQLKREKPKWYDVIVMSHLEDMDNHAIGKTLGISPLLVSQWKHRARKWLLDHYKKSETERDR